MKNVILTVLMGAASLFVACDSGDSEDQGYGSFTPHDSIDIPNFTSGGSESATFRFTSTAAWTITNDTDWVDVDLDFGDEGYNTIEITVDPNTDNNRRTATLKLVATGSVMPLTITQDGLTDIVGSEYTYSITVSIDEIVGVSYLRQMGDLKLKYSSLPSVAEQIVDIDWDNYTTTSQVEFPGLGVGVEYDFEFYIDIDQSATIVGDDSFSYVFKTRQKKSCSNGVNSESVLEDTAIRDISWLQNIVDSEEEYSLSSFSIKTTDPSYW